MKVSTQMARLSTGPVDWTPTCVAVGGDFATCFNEEGGHKTAVEVALAAPQRRQRLMYEELSIVDAGATYARQPCWRFSYRGCASERLPALIAKREERLRRSTSRCGLY